MAKKLKTFNSVACKKYDGMMGRCYREKDGSYANYGAKGIRVCSEWIKDINKFKVWLMDELECLGIPVEYFIANTKTLQLDRIDPRGHYSPTNCRILAVQANQRNKTNSVITKKILISAEGEKIQL